MKKRLWMLALALVLLFAAPARAEDVRGSVLNLLTEVYGYTVEESQAFTIEVNGNEASFYPAGHPEWVYTILYEDGQRKQSTTPFSPLAVRRLYPGESTVREGMRRLKEEWLPAWNEESREQMLAWLEETLVTQTSTLHSGLETGTLSEQDTVREFLVSCYGSFSEWPKAVREWEQGLLADLGLPAPDVRIVRPTRGVNRWESRPYGSDTKKQFVCFVEETPQELEQAFAAPELEGWTLLCGAIYQIDENARTGLAAFGRDGRRWLVALLEGEDGQWALNSLGENSLYPERDFWIDIGSKEYCFDIVYPISDVEKEWFTVLYVCWDWENDVRCEASGYTRQNEATGESFAIKTSSYPEGFQVTSVTADGERKEEVINKSICIQMPMISLNDYPTTLEACREAAEFTLPQGYGYTNGVHLRAKKSTRSKDLGDYNAGTLVQVLGREPGDPYDWYHVRIGRAEGYMSSVYVRYDPDVYTSVHGYRPLPVGEAVEDIHLRDGTGWFAKTVQEVPKGTRVHILAQCGDWLHVLIPQGELESIMDLNGTDGYVKEDQIKRVGLTEINTGN